MLKGDRVVLQPMRREYLERYFEFRNDVELELLSSGEPPMPMELERLQAMFEAHLLRPRSEVSWFAIEVQGGQFVGQCLLHNFDYSARTCELGITIGERDYQDVGYGRDAVKLLVKYAFRLRNMEKVWLTTNGSNVRAQKAFAAAGFVEEGRLRRHVWLDGRYDDLVYMGILRDPRAEREDRDGAIGTEPAMELPDAEDEA
jgi:RimJ/RimL family protein N-acetyltransferase